MGRRKADTVHHLQPPPLPSPPWTAQVGHCLPTCCPCPALLGCSGWRPGRGLGVAVDTLRHLHAHAQRSRLPAAGPGAGPTVPAGGACSCRRRCCRCCRCRDWLRPCACWRLVLLAKRHATTCLPHHVAQPQRLPARVESAALAAAVEAAFGAPPQLGCTEGGQLRNIQLCFDTDGLKLIECPWEAAADCRGELAVPRNDRVRSARAVCSSSATAHPCCRVLASGALA